MSLTLGVLSIQGDVLENVLSVKAAIDALDIDGTVTSVKTPDEISKVDGLIIPGGESTTIGRLSCLLYTSPSPRDPKTSRMPSSA